MVKSVATTTWFQTPDLPGFMRIISRRPGDYQRSKHIDTRRYFVKDAVLNGDIILEYIPTAEQLADRLTKPLSVPNIKSYA